MHKSYVKYDKNTTESYVRSDNQGLDDSFYNTKLGWKFYYHLPSNLN